MAAGEQASEPRARVWRNARLATLVPGQPGLGIVERGAIASQGGKIVYAGPESELPAATTSGAEIVDCEGRWITPGLIDCHTHLVHAGNRANEFEMRLAGATYEEVARAGGGIVSSVKALRAASEDELVRQSLPRLDALIAEGVTTIEIKSGYGLDLENEAKSLRAARRLGRRASGVGAHQLPRRACAAAGSQRRQGRLHRKGGGRDAAGHCRGKAGRCRRRLLRGHRLFAGADRASVRRGPRARPAGQAACRPALQSLRRSPRCTLWRAVGRPSRIYRRAERRCDGAVGHGRRAAARRLLFHPRGKEAAGRSVPRAWREDGSRHRLQSRHLAADLAAAHHEHGGDLVWHDGRGMPRRGHPRGGARARPACRNRHAGAGQVGRPRHLGRRAPGRARLPHGLQPTAINASGGVGDRIRAEARQRLAGRLARHLSRRRARARPGLQAAGRAQRRGRGAHRGARRAGLRHQHRLREARQRAHRGGRSRNPAAQHRAQPCRRRRRSHARRRWRG